MKTLQQIQTEIAAWAEHNFPDATADQPLLGVIEEIGELAHAHLKSLQNIRGVNNAFTDVKDAVGDVVIFSLHLASLLDTQVDPSFCFGSASSGKTDSILETSIACADVVRAFFEGDNLADHLGFLYFTLHKVSLAYGFDFLECVNETWDRVSKRDWQKDPFAGGETK